MKGRALEGLGFAYEAKAAAAPADKDKWLDQASQQFRALENTDVKGFKELGMYHQARVAESKGEKDKAIQLLKSLHERLSTARRDPSVPLSRERRGRPPPPARSQRRTGEVEGAWRRRGGGGGKLTQEQIQQLMEQFKHNQGAGGPGGEHGFSGEQVIATIR